MEIWKLPAPVLIRITKKLFLKDLSNLSKTNKNTRIVTNPLLNYYKNLISKDSEEIFLRIIDNDMIAVGILCNEINKSYKIFMDFEGKDGIVKGILGGALTIIMCLLFILVRNKNVVCELLKESIFKNVDIETLPIFPDDEFKNFKYHYINKEFVKKSKKEITSDLKAAMKTLCIKEVREIINDD